jgi:hypothetical protein
MVKKKLGNILRVVGVEKDYIAYGLFVAVGLLMVIGTLLKLLGIVYLDSDWYWFVAGLGLVVEGSIALVKQKRFNNKFKIISREEFDSLVSKSEIK